MNCRRLSENRTSLPCLGCYTDPYYVTIDGETTEMTHDIARIAYAIIFAAYDYSTWSFGGQEYLNKRL